MDDPKPTLDYAAAGPRSRPRLRRWAFRVSLAVLVFASLWAALVVWLYAGWKREQPAREMVERVRGTICGTEPAGSRRGEYPPIADPERLVPARLRWLRERVTNVRLAGTPATDDDLRMLGRLSRLRALQLDSTGVTDAGLVHLRELTELEYLDLDGTRVTDAGLVHLEGLRDLRKVYLRGTRVTEEGVAQLRRALGCDILR